MFCCYAIQFLMLFMSHVGSSSQSTGIVPSINCRFCVRYLYAKFKELKGKEQEDCLYKATKSITRIEFERNMTRRQQIDKDANQWLVKIKSVRWSRHAFSPVPKYAWLQNNISGSFKSWVLKSKSQRQTYPHLVEYVRTTLMVRIHENTDELKKIKLKVRNCMPTCQTSYNYMERDIEFTWSGLMSIRNSEQ